MSESESCDLTVESSLACEMQREGAPYLVCREEISAEVSLHHAATR